MTHPPSDLGRIRTEADLRSRVPPATAAVQRKKVHRLDDPSRTFLAQTRLAIVAGRDGAGQIHIEAICGSPGFAMPEDDVGVRFGATWGSVPRTARLTDSGSLCLIPGVDETLRLNGTSSASEGGLRISLDELFFHCAKAFVRSRLWSASTPRDSFQALDEHPQPALDRRHLAFIGASPFACLGTSAPGKGTDVSPRGDPMGFVRPVGDGVLLLPDRPGNRLLDNYLNVLAHPFAALLFFIPGVAVTLEVAGSASLTADSSLLEPCTVDGKRPTLGLLLEVRRARLSIPPGMEEAGIWEPSRRLPRGEFPSMGRLVVEQMEPSGRFKGLKARAVDALLRRDTKRNLY